MDLSAVISRAEAAWSWTANKDCQVGLSLSLVCVVLSVLGDGVLYKLLSPVKAASPELALTAVLRPIANLALSSWIMYFAIKQTVLAFGSFAVCAGAVTLVAVPSLFSAWLLGYAYRGPSKGITINVREPMASFGGKNYSHSKSGVAPALFYNFSWIHLSSMLVPFELCIHVLMGNDLDRISGEEGPEACEGMMAQEMNHGKAQLLYSRAAEKDFGFPAGYRKLYKWILMNAPSQVTLAIVCYLESSLVMYTALLSSSPWLFKVLYPHKETQWLWAWHFMEETEHCWDSVEDALGRTQALVLCAMWPVVSAYFFLVFFSNSVVESVLCGQLIRQLNPLTLIPNICVWIFGFTVVVPSIVANNFLRLILRMKPSDEAYTRTAKNWRTNIYLKICDDQFKTTHVQPPHKELGDRDSKTLSQFPRTTRGSIRNSLFFNATKRTPSRALSFVNNSTGEDVTLNNLQEKAVKRVSSFRLSLYEKTEQDLAASGLFTPADIEDAGFSRKSLRRLSIVEQELPSLESLSDPSLESLSEKDGSCVAQTDSQYVDGALSKKEK